MRDVRALLGAPLAATTTSARTRNVLVRALGSELKLEIAETTHRGHAAELAARARTDGLDVVVALGGDGTVNEIVNGLLAAGPAQDTPALAVVPGGSTNVFARALGLPENPVEATGLVLDALREQRRRRIGLGRADGRWFTFCAGLGLDAEVVAQVEEQRARGRVATPGLYVRSAVRKFYRGTDRRHPRLRLERAGHEPVEGLYLAVISNTAPWTYLGRRPVNPSPLASFDTGLDVFALRSLGTLATLRHTRQLLGGGQRGVRGRHVVALHDLREFVLRAEEPVACQVDGEAVGVRTSVGFSAVERALDVVV